MEYVYTKNNVNIIQLEEEIKQSSIVVALDKITLLGNVLTIIFKSALSQAEINALDSIVDNHIPKPQPNSNIITTTPFASKVLENNFKLFKRFIGIQQELTTGNNVITYTIPYNWVKIVGIDVVNCEPLDTANLEILDSSSGTYTGIPNFKLNQFGFNANLPQGFFSVKSNYDSDLYLGMQIKITYNSKSSKTIGINFDFHEVK